MHIAVRYCSRSGNTKRVAEAIGDAAGTAALDVTVPLMGPVDILFLGSALYAGGIDEKIDAFLARNKEKIGMICSFSTTAVAASTYKQIQKTARKYGIPLAEEEFHCRGAFTLLHRDRPNEKDLEAAAAFAKRMIQQGKE